MYLDVEIRNALTFNLHLKKFARRLYQKSLNAHVVKMVVSIEPSVKLL